MAIKVGNDLKPKIVNYNKGTYKGKPFWIGSVNMLDGQIEEVHPYELAKRNSFHHSFYFSKPAQERISNDESGIFWINDDGDIEANWRNEVPENIIAMIKSQIGR